MAGILFSQSRRVLFFGEPGTGKSTLVAQLARAFTRAGRTVCGIDADPGSPAFGIPGTVCRGTWRSGEWDVLRCEALCTLDAARFRLPLVQHLIPFHFSKRYEGGLKAVYAEVRAGFALPLQ